MIRRWKETRWPLTCLVTGIRDPLLYHFVGFIWIVDGREVHGASSDDTELRLDSDLFLRAERIELETSAAGAVTLSVSDGIVDIRISGAGVGSGVVN